MLVMKLKRIPFSYHHHVQIAFVLKELSVLSQKNKEGERKILEVMGMFMALIVVMVSWMYTFL